MKKSEKIVAGLLTMMLGVLFIILKGTFISILMTLVGISLMVIGLIDIINKLVPPAVIKMVTGLLIIVCGWAIVEAVLYILAGVLLVFGILVLYNKIKRRDADCDVLQTVLDFATPGICIAIGILLLFHSGLVVNFVFITSGILAFAEGGVLLFEAVTSE